MDRELVLDPSEFQGEIDAYETKNTEIGAVLYAIDGADIQLDSMDKMQECIDTLNRIISKMNALGQQEVRNMQNMKSAWMNLDEEMGDTILTEYVGDKLDSIFK